MEKIIQTYSNYIKQYSPKLSDEAINYFMQGLTISEFKPKQFYIEADTFQNEIGFVFSGLLRSYYVDDKGSEITVDFIQENNYAGYCTSLDHPKPSKYFFQCIEPSILINATYHHINDCCDKFPELERSVRKIIEDIHRKMLDRMEGFLFDNAETRYLKFVEQYPDLYNRISISDLCTFLGVERQTLTRIRKKLSERAF